MRPASTTVKDRSGSTRVHAHAMSLSSGRIPNGANSARTKAGTSSGVSGRIWCSTPPVSLSGGPVGPDFPADELDAGFAGVDIHSLGVEQGGPIGLRLLLGLGRVDPGQGGVHAVLDDVLGPLDEGVDHLVLRHDGDDLTLDDEVATMAAGRDPEVGVARLARAVDD